MFKKIIVDKLRKASPREMVDISRNTKIPARSLYAYRQHENAVSLKMLDRCEKILDFLGYAVCIIPKSKITTKNTKENIDLDKMTFDERNIYYSNLISKLFE